MTNDELDSDPPQGQGYMQDFMVIATVKALDSIESKRIRNHLYRLIAILAEADSKPKIPEIS